MNVSEYSLITVMVKDDNFSLFGKSTASGTLILTYVLL